VGDTIKIPHTDAKFLLAKRITDAELRRLRRQYIKLSAIRTQVGAAQVAKTFVEYLNANQ